MIVYRRMAEQLRQPKGFWGRVTGLVMDYDNRKAIKWTLSLLDIKPADFVLEIGFGTGLAIKKATSLVITGRVYGIDLSETMLKHANRRNVKAIAKGQVELTKSDINSMPYQADKFDKVFALNVLYFLQSPLPSLQEIYRVLKAGGQTALFATSKDKMSKKKLFQTGVFILRTEKEVVDLLTKAGFRDIRVEYNLRIPLKGICYIGTK
jgi:ubiquinone/menaquinone biosynthesis C-methylase UbiE